MTSMSPEADSAMHRTGYSTSAVIIHWVLAVLIFFLFVSSWWMMALPLPSDNFSYRVFPFQLHKNVGITLLFLAVMLLYVRFKHRPAAEAPPTMKPWMRRLAVADHVVLYVLIAACGLSGYLSSSYSGWGTTLWWLVELPNWGYDDDRLNMLYSDLHAWTAWALLAFIAIHISGVLYHAFRNDGAIRRLMRL
jgi:cytochrome b561